MGKLGAMSDQRRERRRFQFGLRSLFVINLAAAVILGLGRFAAKPESIFTSIVLLLGATWTLLMAALGDAIGREWGAFIQTLLGAGVWCVLIAFAHSVSPVAELWSINLIAMGLTVGAIGALTAIRLREPEDAEDAPHLTHRLLENQKRRKADSSRRKRKQ